MSSFSFIKKHKPQTNSNNNVNIPPDNDSKSKNQDNFNGAPAQPAQSFNFISSKTNPANNTQPQQKKGFGFIKKKNNPNNTNMVNNLEKSNTSINSNDPKFAGINTNTNTNTNNFSNDLDTLINNTNDLLNMWNISNNNENSNNNVNINTLGEPAFQALANIEDDLSNNNNSSHGTQSNSSLPNLNFLNPEPINNNNFVNNIQEKEKPKEKKKWILIFEQKTKEN